VPRPPGRAFRRQLLNEANAAGFEIGIGSGLTPIGKHMITALRVAKVY